MNITELQSSNDIKTPLYINERKIQVLELYDIFNVCEVVYEDNKKSEFVDIMGISLKPKKSKVISLHRF